MFSILFCKIIIKVRSFFFTFQRKHLASEPTEEGSCRPSRPKSRNIDIRYIQIDKNSREREREIDGPNIKQIYR